MEELPGIRSVTALRAAETTCRKAA